MIKEMKGFRTICFIHTDEDSYQVCYLKQFFKWIGFSYFSFVPGNLGVGCEILNKPENRDFDIVVSINQAAQRNDSQIQDVFGSRFIPFEFGKDESKKEKMGQLIKDVEERALSGNKPIVIEGLLYIYQELDMADILYEYTNVLLNLADDKLFTAILEKYEKAVEELDKLEKTIGADENMKEYFLFAKYSCQRKVNELYELKNWIFEYDTGKMIEQIDDIYQFDPGFYRAEYLKAKTAEQDLMERVRAKRFYYECIQKSTIEVCKSYLYYQLGKWQDNGRQVYDAKKSFERAYECNPTNIKAVFKMAVYAKRIRDKQTEVKYLKLLIDSWEERQKNKSLIPLMDLEYAYKSYMLMDDACRTSIGDDTYYSKANEILNFTKELYSGADEKKDYFVTKLYGADHPDTIKCICEATSCRMDIRCKYLGLEETMHERQPGERDG